MRIRDRGKGYAVNEGPVGYETGEGGAVTQITSISTAVTLNKLTGKVTTVSATTAAGAEDAFTVNNDLVAAGDTVVATLQNYAGAGTPQVFATNVAAGSFGITITNLAAAAALNAALVINFTVIRGQSA